MVPLQVLDPVSYLAKIQEIPSPSLENLSDPTDLKNAGLVEFGMDEIFGTLEKVLVPYPTLVPEDDDYKAPTIEGQLSLVPAPPTVGTIEAPREVMGEDVELEVELEEEFSGFELRHWKRKSFGTTPLLPSTPEPQRQRLVPEVANEASAIDDHVVAEALVRAETLPRYCQAYSQLGFVNAFHRKIKHIAKEFVFLVNTKDHVAQLRF
ncbi:hypothetical protein NE237_026183 [Protea cynaroides]|uniref:Uncharacterized protein n=1 Tax=Protea cynaroides TaxID=273540 RepID=A0A9Q0K180_9MAGN|nr:hypothetical protein NE237_026183 [Protea cynaroides]